MNKEKSYSHIIAGGVSGVAASLVTQPLDVLKTNLIGAREKLKVSDINAKGKLQGSISFIKSIYNKEVSLFRTFFNIENMKGIVGLWRGTIPTFWRYLPGGAMYFGSIHFLRNGPLNKNNGFPQTVNDFLIGAISKSSATIATMPILVVKTRFESIHAMESTKSRGLISTITEIHKQQGMRGLFTGVVPTLIRDIPYSGLFYVFYRQTNDFLTWFKLGSTDSNQLISIAAVSSVIAGATATLITHPFDLVRTRMQLPNQGGYNGFMDALITIPKEEGLRTLFFRGIIPKILKRGLAHAISWSLYESTVKVATQ
ncbi:predicted protein [Naegleria gruberi]|uniref:Predicted protein n=1 Tax=Naegleria gruberi TaxID=5762 RepID=D2VSN9_NAEGR|nr:uncharacterized protein NAEGRDRAFT_72007 [Naegleria gruberi]EFC40156.1 predicted protein [Naegleria gruberi]|eukprot:XP_002672900.1 predicted protein [Naegleria gruberi strain NEG-M]